MGKRDDQRKLKLCVLAKIRQNKNVLFGKFSQTLSKQDRAAEWREINSFAQSIGVVDSTREWNYVRDVWWPNVRKTSMEKVDNSRKTGTGGGKENTLTPVDEEVISIVGKDSPTVQGLPVTESLTNEHYPSNFSHSPSPSPSTLVTTPTSCSIFTNPVASDSVHETPASPPKLPASTCLPPASSFSNPVPSAPSSTTVRKPNSKKPSSGDSFVDEEKRSLQLELLRVQVYKGKLEARKLEIEMGLPPSELTSSLVPHDGFDILNFSENE